LLGGWRPGSSAAALDGGSVSPENFPAELGARGLVAAGSCRPHFDRGLSLRILLDRGFRLRVHRRVVSIHQAAFLHRNDASSLRVSALGDRLVVLARVAQDQIFEHLGFASQALPEMVSETGLRRLFRSPVLLHLSPLLGLVDLHTLVPHFEWVRGRRLLVLDVDCSDGVELEDRSLVGTLAEGAVRVRV